MDAKAAPALRRVLKAFIEADARDIVLHRPKFSITATGGYVKSHFYDVPTQRFRLVSYRRRLTDLTTPQADGEVPTLPYVLVGTFDCNLKRMDEFTLDNIYYRVQGIEPKTNNRETTDRVVAQLIALDQGGVEWLV